MLIASAPGKIHLIGEHAVVYGEPAIIAAIGMRTYVRIENSKNISYTDLAWPDISHIWNVKKVFGITQRTIELWNAGSEKKDFSELFNFIKSKKYEGYRASVLGIAMKMLGIDKGFSIKVDSKIPTGAGLGSSASRAVAITKAIGEFFKKKISLEKINEIAYQQEKIIHGTPSGGDNTACCFGGLIWFKKAKPKVEEDKSSSLTELPQEVKVKKKAAEPSSPILAGARVNEIKSLKKEIPYKLKNFVLVYTKVPEKMTGELVQMVRQLNEDYRNKRIKEIGKLTKEMLEVLKEKDFERMNTIINLTQKNLTELGVSCKEID